MQWWCSAQGIAWTWSWRPYPGVWLFVGLLVAGYAALRRAGPAPAEGWRAWAFAGGVLALWIALDWPIGALGGGYLASVHMLQFLLVALVAPPLLLAGAPTAAWRGFEGRPALRRAAHPLVTLALYNLVVVATHAPPVVDGLMGSQLGSFAIDMAWLGAGLVFWWPLAAPSRRRSPEIFELGYLLAQVAAMTPLFVWLTFSALPLYATYELAPPVHGIAARDDQQAAGLLMKIGGMAVLLAAAGVVFVRWGLREARAADGATR